MKARTSNSKAHTAIVAEASAWFIEFRAGDVSGESRTQFIDWLRQSPEHIQVYLDISRIWAELPASEAAGKFDIGALIEDARRCADVVSISASDAQIPAASSVPRPQARRRRRWLELAGAAIVLLTIVGIRQWIAQTPPAYATAIGEQRTIQLADGSTIELNSKSSVQVRLGDRRRDVTLLEGQALFRVAKDRSRPFVVHAGDAEVRAVGTEFDVYRKRDETVVTVVEGRVETHDESGVPGAPPIILSAGEQLTVAPHMVTKPVRTDTEVATAWLQKHLVFEDTPLADVAEQFNRYSRRPLVIDDRTLQQTKISGIYSSTDPTSLISFLRNQPGILVIETDKQVSIVRRDPN
jgi:transmembrane sensor